MAVAEWLAHWLHMQEVPGSNPGSGMHSFSCQMLKNLTKIGFVACQLINFPSDFRQIHFSDRFQNLFLLLFLKLIQNSRLQSDGKKFLAFELHFNFGKKREREGRSKMQKMWENFFGMFLQIHLLLLFLQKYEGGWLPARRSSLKLLFKQKQLEFQNTYISLN